MFWQFAITIAVSILFGSVTATILKILYDRWQSAVPKIHYLLELDKLFSDSDTGSEMKAFVSVYEGKELFPISNFSLLKLQFKNVSGQDFKTFAFGITLPERHGVIKVVNETKDHYHLATCAQQPTAAQPCQSLDFTCTPLNRGDDLKFTFYIASKYSLVSHSNIVVATGAPVNLVRANSPASMFSPKDKVASTLAFITWSLAFISILFCCGGFQGVKGILDDMNKQIKEMPDKLKEEEKKEKAKETEKKTKEPVGNNNE